MTTQQLKISPKSAQQEVGTDDLQRRRFRPYPTYRKSSNDWLRDIPASWTEKPLKRIVAINSEKLPETTDPDFELDYVDIANVTLLNGITSTERFRFEDAPSRARRGVRHGDTIVSTVRTYLKAVAFIDSPPDNLIVSTGFAVLRPGPAVRPRFLFRLAQSELFVQRVVAHSVGVSYPAINPPELGRLNLPMPPLAEQDAIATFLDRETARIDALIAKKQRLIELLQEKRAAVIDHAVTQGLDATIATKATGFNWLGDVPSHWKVRAFRYSARIPNGQVDPEAPEFRDLPLIAPNHIESGTGRLASFETAAEQAAESGKYFFEAGSVLYSKIRPALAKVCIAPERGLCSADMYPLLPRSDLRAKYLMYFMLSRTFTAAAVLMSDRVAMPKINRRDLGAFPIFVPPLGEQDAIIARIEQAISAVDALADREHSAITTLNEYRSALISAAVTGKIDVRELEMSDYSTLSVANEHSTCP